MNINDRLTIHELLSHLDHAVDQQDWDAYLTYVSPSARFDSGFGGPPITGRDAIRAFLVENEGNTSGKRHVASNVVLEADGDRIKSRSYLTVVEREEAPRVVATAVLSDVFEKAGDDWLLAERVVSIDPGFMRAAQS